MSPDLNQHVARYRGEAYTLAFTVDLGDPDGNAASVTDPVFWMGPVTIGGGNVTVADQGAGVVLISVAVGSTTFSALDSGTYLWELSLKLGGDPAVVAGGTFALDRSYSLEAEA